LKPISFHPEARDEADAAALYYHQRNPVVARDFLFSVERISHEIQAAPQRWPFEGETGVQRRQVRGFLFTVFYVNLTTVIVILAIAHTSRRPGYWRPRLGR
jgi:plasmid stabilization system protein ParE